MSRMVFWNQNPRSTNPVAERVADSQLHILMWKQRCCEPYRKMYLYFKIYTHTSYNILEHSVNRTRPQRDPTAG